MEAADFMGEVGDDGAEGDLRLFGMDACGPIK